jgi:hypothetical protein
VGGRGSGPPTPLQDASLLQQVHDGGDQQPTSCWDSTTRSRTPRCERRSSQLVRSQRLRPTGPRKCHRDHLQLARGRRRARHGALRLHPVRASRRPPRHDELIRHGRFSGWHPARERRPPGRGPCLVAHDPRGTLRRLGQDERLEDQVEWAKRIQDRILDIFANHSRMAKSTIKPNWARKDSWLSSDDALKHGLVDELRGAPRPSGVLGAALLGFWGTFTCAYETLALMRQNAGKTSPTPITRHVQWCIKHWRPLHATYRHSTRPLWTTTRTVIHSRTVRFRQNRSSAHESRYQTVG